MDYLPSLQLKFPMKLKLKDTTYIKIYEHQSFVFIFPLLPEEYWSRRQVKWFDLANVRVIGGSSYRVIIMKKYYFTTKVQVSNMGIFKMLFVTLQTV